MVETGDGPLEAELTTDEEHLLWTWHEQVQKKLKHTIEQSWEI